MASQAQISLRFSRSATAASSVKVSVCDAAGKPIDGATASLTSSHAFKATGNAVTAAMLCPNVNGNTSPTITLTFKIDGLPDALSTPHYALLDIHALNASGSYQSNNDGKARQFNVEINGGSKAASSEIKGQLTNVDIAAGIGDETGVHQEWSLPLSATCQLGNSLYLRLTVTAGKSNMGCFFGLTSVSLVEKMPEPEFRPFEASDETGSPKMIYSLLTPKGQALAMNAEGTLALEPRTDAPSQTWYFVGKNALAGGYLLVNAQGNRSYAVSGNEAARWVAKQSAEQPAFFSLHQMVGEVAGEALNVSGDTLFVVRPARNAYSHHAQIYDMPCGTLSGTYLTHLELRDTQDAQPLIYPANALANGAVVGKKAGKPANWYTIYTKAAAHTSPGSTLTLSGLLNQRLDDGESLTAYFDWNRDGLLQGKKRSTYEGGIRIPFIVRWPGHVKAGTVNDHQLAFYDLMPTFCDLAGIKNYEKRYRNKSLANDYFDGISFYPTLTGKGKQKKHDYLYWEFHETNMMGLRMGNWKLVVKAGQCRLYDLATDLHEDHDIAAKHPDIVKKMKDIILKEHTDSPIFKLTLPK